MDLDGENPLIRLGESKTDIVVFVGLVALSGVLVFAFLGPKRYDLGVSPENPIGTEQKFVGFLESLKAQSSAPVTKDGLITTTYKVIEGEGRRTPVVSEADLTVDEAGRLLRVVVRTVYVDPIEQPALFSTFGRGFDHYWRAVSNQPREFTKRGAGTDTVYSEFRSDVASGLWIKSRKNQKETITLSRIR